MPGLMTTLRKLVPFSQDRLLEEGMAGTAVVEAVKGTHSYEGDIETGDRVYRYDLRVTLPGREP
jgi:hypothetical protein